MDTMQSIMGIPLPYQFAFGLVWIGLWIGASVFYRKSKHKPLYPRRPDHSVFFESRGSGRSNQNVLTKLGGARRCLQVAVTDNALIIQPMFPFNLMFLPEVYGLEYNIPLKNIHTVEEKRGIFGRTIMLVFTAPDTVEHSIELQVRAVDQFLRALKS